MEKKKIVVWVLVGGFIFSILAMGMAEAKPVTYRDGNRIITIDEEEGWVHVMPYQSPADKFLSFFSSLSPMTVVPQDTVKGNVAEFYRKAKAEQWYDFNVYANEVKVHGECGYYDPDKEECSTNDLHHFIYGSVLSTYNDCSDLSQAKKDTISTLGFTEKFQCFWCRDCPTCGGIGVTNCHIQYNGRELTVDELWLPDLKERAIALGYVVQDVPESVIGWGIYGTTMEEVSDNYFAFTDETGVMGSASRYSVAGGYAYCQEVIYAFSMVEITEPISTPTPTPTSSPTPTPTASPTATPSPTPTSTPPTNGTPSFEGVVAIAGILLASCFFIFGRRRNKWG